jgi:hypothetical protein
VGNRGPSQDTGQVSVSTYGNFLTVTSASGSGWFCHLTGTGAICSRSDPLPAGQSFPSISIAASVSTMAPETVTFGASVSAPGNTNSANDTSSDVAAVAQLQAIAFGTLADRAYSINPFQIGAMSSSGLPVAFSSTGSCTVSGNSLGMTAPGVCTVTASQAGNSVYLPAANVVRSFHFDLWSCRDVDRRCEPAFRHWQSNVLRRRDAVGEGSRFIAGTASMSVLLEATGPRSLLARYGGDATSPGSASPPVIHVLNSLPSPGFQTTSLPSGSAGTIETGDFNGDGKLDLAAVGLTGITVFPGNGDGTFGAGILTTFAGGRLIQPFAADFDGDGKLDLAIVFGNGDGTFGSPASYALPGNLITVADLNNDGFPDLAIGSSSNFTINLNSEVRA